MKALVDAGSFQDHGHLSNGPAGKIGKRLVIGRFRHVFRGGNN